MSGACVNADPPIRHVLMMCSCFATAFSVKRKARDRNSCAARFALSQTSPVQVAPLPDALPCSRIRPYPMTPDYLVIVVDFCQLLLFPPGPVTDLSLVQVLVALS